MKIELKRVTVKELFEGFVNSEEEGVLGYGGRLNIRPKYQREFVYNEAQRKAVIDTVSRGYPLNVMYWAENADGTFELLDGQQRTLSLCSYLAGEFAVDWGGTLRGYANLLAEQRVAIDGYELMVYVCREGSDKEKLDWFQVINIAGERLFKQEIRNAVYSGAWVTAAKHKFSKTGCVAYNLAAAYMSGKPIRQDYLETAIDWHAQALGIGGEKDERIERYMLAHQHDTNADDLWLYFQGVVQWVMAKFPRNRREMKSVAWGELYNRYRDARLDAAELERRVAALMRDGEVDCKAGIYAYVLDGDERHLKLRAFDENTRREAYERQGGRCANPRCAAGAGVVFDFEEMEADHITPWSKGGRTVAENCQMLCRTCNRTKGNR